MLRSISRPALAFFLAGASGLAACSDSSTGAITAPAAGAPVRSVAASENGEYLVRLKGSTAGFQASVEALGGAVSYIHERAGFAVVSGLSADGATQLAGASAVAEVLPNVVMSLGRPQEAVREEMEVGIASQANPATAIRYSWQWNMKAINADKAWAAGKLGNAGVTVAILDTGIDYTSLDARGLVDLSRSVSFIPSDNAIRAANFPSRHDVDDFNGHGTNVASQVSSTGFAHAGVSSRTTLMGVKVLGANGSGSFAAILQGMLWAADHDADVINMSLGAAFTKAGGNGQLVGLFNQVLSYANRQGAVVVVAAGNESTDLDHNMVPDATGEMQRYPSLYAAFCDATHVICVSATGPETFGGNPDVPSYYTNFGRSAVTVAGPGGNVGATKSMWPWDNPKGTGSTVSWVWSMCPRNLLPNPANPAFRPCASGGVVNAMIGTSQAAPHVAGLAALLVAEMGKDKPAQIKARIQQSAVDAGQPGTDPYFGKGRIDVARALGL
ncbi:MAG TPA: S8 family serine peptidase [Longimicrobiaceae bacterium]|nr:S8 family serine peptidase [Longimicrobiaceae bacterium]